MKQLWHNGTIYTMEREDETVESVLVEAGDDGRAMAIQQLVEPAQLNQ